MKPLRHLLFNVATTASMLLFLAVLIFWTWNNLSSTSSFLGIGRGHFAFDILMGRSDCSLSLSRYDRPLTKYHPDAKLIRTRGYGWFVGESRDRAIRGAGFAIVCSESEYEFRPVIFKREWSVEAPNWFLLVVTAIGPFLVFRRWRFRRQLR